MSELTEFLIARIAEDEAFWTPEVNDLEIGNIAERILTECEAKRRIVEDFETLHGDYQVTHDPGTEARRLQAMVALAHLAAVYAEHPDYREEWKP